MKHTSEPWKIHPHAGFDLSIRDCGPYKIGNEWVTGSNLIAIIELKDKRQDVKEERTANAERIVACVNGCAGVPDPSIISELIDSLDDCLAVIFAAREMSKEIPDCKAVTADMDKTFKRGLKALKIAKGIP